MTEEKIEKIVTTKKYLDIIDRKIETLKKSENTFKTTIPSVVFGNNRTIDFILLPEDLQEDIINNIVTYLKNKKKELLKELDKM